MSWTTLKTWGGGKGVIPGQRLDTGGGGRWGRKAAAAALDLIVGASTLVDSSASSVGRMYVYVSPSVAPTVSPSTFPP